MRLKNMVNDLQNWTQTMEGRKWLLETLQSIIAIVLFTGIWIAFVYYLAKHVLPDSDFCKVECVCEKSKSGTRY
jgi:hypothetical protein